MAKPAYTYTPEQKQGMVDLRNKIYGENPLDYEGTFKQAYENLGQPYENPDTNGFNGLAAKIQQSLTPEQRAQIGTAAGQTTTAPATNPHQQVAEEGTKNLADAFISEYFKSFGQLPDEGAIKDFVGQNLNSRYASQYITGLPQDQLIANVVRPYIKDNGADIAPNTGNNTPSVDPLQAKLDQYYGQAAEGLTSQVNDAYNTQKTNVADELAATGMTDSPTSRYTLNALEGSKNKALSQSLGSLAEKKASGQLGVAGELARIDEQSKEFGASQALKKQQFAEDQYKYDTGLGLQRQSMSLAQALGRAQAGANQSGWQDYLNTGLKVASTGAQVAAAFA